MSPKNFDFPRAATRAAIVAIAFVAMQLMSACQSHEQEDPSAGRKSEIPESWYVPVQSFLPPPPEIQETDGIAAVGVEIEQPVTVDPSIVAAVNGFALNLFRELDASRSNRFVSPYSLHIALTLAALGADGETLKELYRALNFPPPTEGRSYREALKTQVLPAYRDLIAAVAVKEKAAENGKDSIKNGDITASANQKRRIGGLFGAPQPGEGNDPKRKPVILADNIFWHANSLKTLPAYKNDVDGFVHQAIRFLEGYDPNSLRAVNEWVAERTQGFMKDVVKENQFADNEAMTIINVAYLFDYWKKKFDDHGTVSSLFNLSEGRMAEGPFMSKVVDLPLCEMDKASIVELELSTTGASVLLILPSQNEMVDSVLRWLTVDRLAGINRCLKTEEGVYIWLPKFTMNDRVDSAAVYNNLGIRQAFDMRTAHFPFLYVNNTNQIYLSKILQDSRLEVNEEGVEAAAVTRVHAIMRGGDETAIMKELRFNRPFIVIIRNNNTEAIIFAGSLIDPSKADPEHWTVKTQEAVDEEKYYKYISECKTPPIQPGIIAKSLGLPVHYPLPRIEIADISSGYKSVDDYLRMVLEETNINRGFGCCYLASFPEKPRPDIYVDAVIKTNDTVNALKSSVMPVRHGILYLNCLKSVFERVPYDGCPLKIDSPIKIRLLFHKPMAKSMSMTITTIQCNGGPCEESKMIIMRRDSPLKYCIQREFLRSREGDVAKKMPEKWSAEFEIDPGGMTQHVEISIMANENMKSCLKDTIRHIIFPKPLQETVTKISIEVEMEEKIEEW